MDPRHPGIAEGLAPIPPTPAVAMPTTLCAHCATLIRAVDELGSRWRHCAIGFDHEAEPVEAWRRISGSRAEILEQERATRELVGSSTYRALRGLAGALAVHDAPAGAGDDVEAYRG